MADESRGARGGHGYLLVHGDAAELWTFRHSSERTPGMLERLERWQAAHPPSAEEKLRRRCPWAEPGGTYFLRADLGTVERTLRGKRLTIRSGDEDPPPELSEPFLRAPVRRAVEGVLPAVRWPERLDASELRFAYSGKPFHAQKGDHLVVAAARYGSAYTKGGQYRTAAVFLSKGGTNWEELPWTQHEIPRYQSCWPPETVYPLFDGECLVLRWEDPWIDWEPGCAWEGRWDPASRAWSVTATD